MQESALRRRDLLVAVSAGYATLAGCSAGSTAPSGYEIDYGRGYGTA